MRTISATPFLATLAAVTLVAATLAAGPALAHHPLAGAPMTTFSHGVLSGIGHPLLGVDHLFFVLAVGIASAFTPARLLAPLGYVGGMVAGVALILAGVALPMVEPVIALSLVIVGGLVMSGRSLPVAPLVAVVAVLGLFHGWAFGESLAGAEGGAAMGVTAGYLIGLAACQWAIAVAAGHAVTGLLGARAASATAARLSGALVAGAGAFLVLEVVEGAAFAALGLA
ncbi:MAG: HupE/UreJ family protein [Pseudomonadota bacterium]